MITRAHVAMFLALSVALWAGLLTLRGFPVTWALLWPFGVVVTFSAGAVTAFDRWAWAWLVCRGWLVHRPDLRGTWRGTIQSNWPDRGTGECGSEVPCFMVIEQTWTSISLRQLTAESSSSLLGGSIERSGQNGYFVTGVYANWPEISLREERSAPHRGALLLEPHGKPPSRLSGEYWTERNTKGRLELIERAKPCVTGFLEAVALFKKARKRQGGRVLSS